jgi:phosphoribosylglycinamide formyltransferase-1
MMRVAVFASGSGSNAENLIKFWQQKPNAPARVVLLVSGKPDAPVVDKARRLRVPVVVISRRALSHPEDLIRVLKSENIDALVLLGFLWLLPPDLIQAYAGKILNLHPSLLPDFGGKGMYGMHVHEAVVASGAPKSGITLHVVNEEFDRGPIVAQFALDLHGHETAFELSQRIHALEQQHVPEAVEIFLLQQPRH